MTAIGHGYGRLVTLESCRVGDGQLTRSASDRTLDAARHWFGYPPCTLTRSLWQGRRGAPVVPNEPSLGCPVRYFLL